MILVSIYADLRVFLSPIFERFSPILVQILGLKSGLKLSCSQSSFFLKKTLDYQTLFVYVPPRQPDGAIPLPAKNREQGE